MSKRRCFRFRRHAMRARLQRRYAFAMTPYAAAADIMKPLRCATCHAIDTPLLLRYTLLLLMRLLLPCRCRAAAACRFSLLLMRAITPCHCR